MKKFGLIGYPLSHSFSQKYFSEKFKRENILDADYENFSIPSINLLNNIIGNNPGLVGLNVTIPYKQSVIHYLDEKKNLPIDACNCILIRRGQLIGYNTDIVGFEESLKPALQAYHKRALILGNGGATAAVKYVLKKLEIQFSIVSRQTGNNFFLSYENLSAEIIQQNLLIINTS
ncbi:MAG TPA: hypothetical protein VKR53_04680, partial [Puia sp.]|nr:hypothetical protein [Puia sp.]